jgi:hypothetical protein
MADGTTVIPPERSATGVAYGWCERCGWSTTADRETIVQLRLAEHPCQ